MRDVTTDENGCSTAVGTADCVTVVSVSDEIRKVKSAFGVEMSFVK